MLPHLFRGALCFRIRIMKRRKVGDLRLRGKVASGPESETASPRGKKAIIDMTPPVAAAQRRFIQNLADGDSVEEIYLVVDKQLRANRNGNLYIQVELRDRSGTLSGRLWN